MVDATLRCNEVFRSPGHNMASANGASYQDLLPSFCQAYRDCALLGDRRVLLNMLRLGCRLLAWTSMNGSR